MKDNIFVKLNDAEKAVQRYCKACVDLGENGGIMADLSCNLIQQLNTVPQIEAPIGWIRTDDRMPRKQSSSFSTAFMNSSVRWLLRMQAPQPCCRTMTVNSSMRSPVIGSLTGHRF